MLAPAELEQFKADLFSRAFTRSVRAYADEVFERMGEHLRFDLACIGVGDVVVTDKQETGLKLVQGFPYRTNDKMLPMYADNSHYDPFVPSLALSPQTAMDRHTRIEPYEVFRESAIYRRHCHRFGIRHAIGVVFQIPGSNRFLFSGMFRSDAQDFFSLEDEAFAQSVFPALYYILAGKLELYNHCSTAKDEYIRELCLRYKALTRRQAEIVYWMARESVTASKELAKVMGVSPKTVENHLHEVYHKLDVNGTQDPKVQVIRKVKAVPV